MYAVGREGQDEEKAKDARDGECRQDRRLAVLVHLVSARQQDHQGIEQV